MPLKSGRETYREFININYMLYKSQDYFPFYQRYKQMFDYKYSIEYFPRYVNHLPKDIGKASVETVMALANALGCKIETILG